MKKTNEEEKGEDRDEEGRAEGTEEEGGRIEAQGREGESGQIVTDDDACSVTNDAFTN